ncbi:MAG: hypothetical protein OXU20_04620 [Myxococcales bacterium]|nr:hypothetical protein [Myxococcales bacterium]MDD9969680.1 hypothetical protein [Myxococcales bacterium]
MRTGDILGLRRGSQTWIGGFKRVHACRLLLLVWLAPAGARADPGAETRIGGDLGVLHMQLHDELVRGLRWSGPGAMLGLTLAHDGSDDTHLGRMRFPLAMLGNRYDHGGISWDVQLDYGYARTIVRPSPVLQLDLGARLRWDWAVQYYEDFDEEHLYWMTAYELGPLVALTWLFAPSHSLRGTLDTSLLSLVSRPPERRFYKIGRLTHVDYFFSKTHERMRVTTVHEHLPARVGITYTWRMGERARLQSRLLADFVYDSEPRAFMMLAFALTAGYAHAL